MPNTSLLASRYLQGIVTRMELRHLRYFVGVAEELNFTKAARKLRVAQPALSRQIRQLEEEIGAKLLERGRPGVRLTGAGQAFLTEARALLEHSQQAIHRARQTNQSIPEKLNVGYVWGLFHSLAPTAAGTFRRECPDVAVNLFDLSAIAQAAALAEGRLDLGFIGLAQEADSAGLEKMKIGSCDFVAALPKTHPAARHAKVSLETLAKDFFFVISEQTYPGAATVIHTACAQAGFRPKVLQTAERGHTILSLVAGNCGVALLPEPLRALPHAGVVFRPLTRPVRADLFMAWRRGNDSKFVEQFRVATLRAVNSKEHN